MDQGHEDCARIRCAILIVHGKIITSYTYFMQLPPSSTGSASSRVSNEEEVQRLEVCYKL